MDPDQLYTLLDTFHIETPSWGYADTGTRFGKFLQPAAASTIDEKLADAGVVNKFTGCCPSVAVHVLWDFSVGVDAGETAAVARKHGVRIGSVNPNLFEDQIYKFGSVCSPDDRAREHAQRHVADSIQIAKAVGSKVLSLWFADGTNYPGQDDIITRKHRMHGALRQWHDSLPPGMTMLVEYKPFEPAFYHTDVADWGMSYVFAKDAGERAKVLVDVGHHLQGQNIEHLVAFLLDEGMLGGFHLNDRKYADDDLTVGSIDPYQVFRIFHEIRNAHELHGCDVSTVGYTIDQSHNLKPKIEAMIQTVTTAQELFAKACLVDRAKLRDAQARTNVIDAEECLRTAFFTDVKPLLAEWRKRRGIDPDPLAAYRASGYEERAAREREASRAERGARALAAYA
ncbi:MAG: Xylose isomerase domain protein barrel [Phycisphaerales bacterium]|jgi:L-rhamnose isomerase/sugar isomerase|nr:Xylose isomerase domain protein barrel [Phycisphaerales bacterium]